MKIIVDEIDISECPFYYMGKCRCGVYVGSCDFEPENDQKECALCISIDKIKDGDPD
mgnify:FL=1